MLVCWVFFLVELEIFYWPTLKGPTQASRRRLCPLHQAVRHCYTWRHRTSNTQTSLIIQVSKRPRIVLPPCFLEVPLLCFKMESKRKCCILGKRGRKWRHSILLSGHSINVQPQLEHPVCSDHRFSTFLWCTINICNWFDMSSRSSSKSTCLSKPLTCSWV